MLPLVAILSTFLSPVAAPWRRLVTPIFIPGPGWPGSISAATAWPTKPFCKKHSLNNLTLRQCRIEDADSLGRNFDFIVSHGVLHHLPDPAAGLRSLGKLLRPEGVIDALDGYARYGRVGVYICCGHVSPAQLEQTEQGVAIVKDALSVLGPHHPRRRYLQLPLDLDTKRLGWWIPSCTAWIIPLRWAIVSPW